MLSESAIYLYAPQLTKWEGHTRRYELIAGERRWRASILAERPAIPALIRVDSALVLLSAHERAMLEGLGSKLEQWLENPARLAPADWEILGPIAQRLGELLGRVQESRAS